MNKKVSILAGRNSGNQLSRRDFMQGAIAGAVVAGAVNFSPSSARAEPVRGGTLRFGAEGGATSDTLDPKFTAGIVHPTSSALSLYDTLTEPRQNGGVAASLASEWEALDGGKRWSFKIRPGAEFSNGKKVTAEDVIWSYKQHLKAESTAGDAKTYVKSFTELKADGPDRVSIELDEPNHDVPIMLAAYALIVAPAETVDWNAGVGSGPYKLETYAPGVRFLASRKRDYYRDDDGWFDSIEILNLSDPTARMNALLNQSVDVISSPSANAAKRVASISGLSLTVVPGGRHFTTSIRLDRDPFTNNHLRQAIKWGVRRQEIVDKVFSGYADIGNDHPIAKTNKYFNNTLEQTEFDIDKAKFHLNKSGYAGIELPLTVSNGAVTGSEEYGQLMQSTLREVGLNVRVNRVAADGYWSEVFRKNSWYATYWAGRATADMMLSVIYASDAAYNDTKFSNPEFDKLLKSAKIEPDESIRRQKYFECQRLLRDEGGSVVLAFVNDLIASSEKMGHGDVGNSYKADDLRIPRRWWFATS